MENHLRATHNITDNVLYKKYLRAAIPESSVDPIVDDGLKEKQRKGMLYYTENFGKNLLLF